MNKQRSISGFIFIEHMVILFFGMIITLSIHKFIGNSWWAWVPLILSSIPAIMIFSLGILKTVNDKFLSKKHKN
jgi:hypothetical protein